MCIYSFFLLFYFSSSWHLIIYFILEWTSLVKYIKSVQHMLGLRNQSVQSGVIILLNTGVLVLTPRSLYYPLAVSHKPWRLMCWTDICLKDGCCDLSGWHSIYRNKQAEPAMLHSEKTKEWRQLGDFFFFTSSVRLSQSSTFMGGQRTCKPLSFQPFSSYIGL